VLSERPCIEFLSLPEERRAKHPERTPAARARLAQLAQEVPELTLVLPPGAPAKTVVKRDGHVVDAAALGVAVPLDPGEHTVTTQAPGGPAVEIVVTLAKGEKKKVALEVELPARPKPLPSPPLASPALPASVAPSGFRVASYVAFGVGFAGLVTGGVLGGLALGQGGARDRHCGAAAGSADPAVCDSIGLQAVRAGLSLANGSTIALALGGAALATGGVLLLVEPGPPKAASGSRGRRAPAGVLSAGPAGAMVGARWSF
jgi:hypothetical protein